MKTIRTILLALLACALPVAAQIITTRTLDFGSGPDGGAGDFASLAVVNGNPAIAYYNNTDMNLMFARNSAADGSGTWTVTVVDYVGIMGQYCSLAVVNGTPAISYYDNTNFDLKYVRALDANGTSWGTPVTLDSTGNVGQYTSLKVVNGKPAICYYDVTNRALKYIRANTANGTQAGDWGAPMTLDNTSWVGRDTSLAVVNGNPAISYSNWIDGDLKYVRALDANGTSWGTPVTLDSSGAVGFNTSLAVVNGNPAISYSDGTNGDLKYVRANTASGTLAGDWGTPVTIDSTGTVGWYTSLAVVNDNPAISYYDDTNGDLKYMRALDANGTSWGTPVTLDSTGTVGWYTSLAVVNGTPAISYYDATNLDLKYVRATTASGTLADDWDTPTTPDAGVQSGQVGQFTSQAIVNGTPAIAYYDLTNRDLKYMRALNAAGTSWGTPVTLDSTGNMGEYPSLKVINGNPAISYRGDNTLKYVRALDANGSGWGTPVTLDSSGAMGTGTSLAVVNGNPAISYFGYSNGGKLKYVRANTANGTLAGDWGTPVTILNMSVTTAFTSLAVANGAPAISFSYGTLVYVRATTASGMLADDWDTPVVLDSSISSVSSNSLVVVNGNPAVSYYDATNGDLKYVRATTASGTLAGDWGTPLTLDSTGDVGGFASLVVVNGNPAISYYDATNGDLKYMRATTASGTSWGTPLTLDSTGDMGSYASLAVVNGNPAISYYDNTNDNLKWATYGVTAPTVTTPTSESVTTSSAMLGGNVESDGGATITERGVVYSLTSANADPLIGGSGVTTVTASGTTGVFTTAIGSLAAGSTYSFRAYATNSVGTSYTSAASFTTLTPGPEIALFHGASTAPANERTDNIGTFGFGSVGTGSSSAAQTFTIKNTGTVANLTSIAVTKAVTGNPDDFTVNTTGMLTTLPPNATTTFTVTFSPTANGARTAALLIASNDADENPFDIALTGTGIVLPTVTAISPSSGGTEGGTSVTITGENFIGVTGVTIGGAAATDVIVFSPTTITCTTPPGSAGSASVQITNVAGTNVANTLFTYVVTVDVELPAALDTPGRTYILGGDGNWFRQTGTTHDAADAAQSGPISHNQETWFETTVTGSGNLSFWWKVSSESGFDYLEFYVDGVLQTGSISGDVDWEEKSYTLGAGSHTLRWRYMKDGSEFSGSDAGWVDEVVWTPDGGSFASWQSQHFTPEELNNPLISGPNATPRNDGVANLLKYAFNMDLAGPNVSTLTPGSGTSGLPSITQPTSGILRFEFLRRIGSGLNYAPKMSATLAPGSWSPLTDTPTVTPIDANWERVIYEEPYDTLIYTEGFGRIEVTLP